ncbi:uncharacterized protein LOC135698505 [Ochlerotatus camptorhynchus]|uniref:uncharacterized protein LOC135698505 n=1 Tax=Ochlerotatus camptorhynchus TaxID=644619 RepID=UPI0031D076AD
MQRTKNREAMAWDTSEEQQEEDRVSIEYNGRYFSIPRSHYERRLTPEDFNQSDELIRLRSAGASGRSAKTVSYADKQDAQVKASDTQRSKTSTSRPPLATEPLQWRTSLDQSLNFLENLEGNFRQSMSQPSAPSDQKSPPKIVEENKGSNVESIFTLENMIESKQTIIEQPITKKTSLPSAPDEQRLKSSSTLGAPSAESLEARKSMEVTEKLFQLKSKVVSLIDQTINQIESEQDFTGEGPSKAIPLHPSGDGSKLDYRALNLQVLKTDSFARNRKDIRTKLYREIKTVLKRLEDLESLG